MNSESAIANASLLWEIIRQRIADGALDAEVVINQLQQIVESNQPYFVDCEGYIHLTLVLKGLTPSQWGHYFQSEGRQFSESAMQALYCAKGVSAKNVVCKMVVRPGHLIADSERVTRKLRSYAAKRGWETPHWEVLCLLRASVTDEQLRQMGLKDLVVMHEPIVDLDGNACLLGANVHGGGLDVYLDGPNNEWCRNSGFVHVER